MEVETLAVLGNRPATGYTLESMVLRLIFTSLALFASHWAWCGVSSLEALEAEERALDQEYFELTSRWGTAERTLASFAHEVGALDLQTREVLKQLKPSRKGLAADLPPSLLEVLQKYQAYDEVLERFQTKYDRFLVRKIAFLVDYYFSVASTLADTSHARALLENLRRQKDTLLELMEKKPIEVGDSFRFSGVRPFAESLVGFWEEVSRGKRTPSETFASMGQSLKRFFVARRQDLALSFEHRQALNLLKNNQPGLGAYAPALQRAARWSGYTNEFVGREHVDAPIAPGVVRVYAASHTHWLLDAVSAVSLPLETAKVYNAPTFWAPAWLTPLLVKNKQFVCVLMPDGGDPTLDVIKDFRNGSCNAIYIMPQGSLGTGLAFEIQSPAENFAILLSIFKRKGFGLEILPMSVPYHYRLFSDHLSDDRYPQRLETRIHPPLTPEMADFLMQTGDLQSVSRWIRQLWLDSAYQARSFEPHYLGSPPLRLLMKRLNGYLAGRANCEALLSAFENPPPSLNH